MDYQSLAKDEGPTGERVAVAEFRVGASGHALLVREADVSTADSAKSKKEYFLVYIGAYSGSIILVSTLEIVIRNSSERFFP